MLLLHLFSLTSNDCLFCTIHLFVQNDHLAQRRSDCSFSFRKSISVWRQIDHPIDPKRDECTSLFK